MTSLLAIANIINYPWGVNENKIKMVVVAILVTLLIGSYNIIPAFNLACLTIAYTVDIFHKKTGVV